ncbi:archaeal proteasome endopeptidase complex subunit alpha [archaeon]|nr:archaeal proteasome endopeptidase complex subunit alpha [archaeon]
MQQDISHQMMGYDRASTMFSPDGRLLQVEYAKEAVKQGSTALGIVCRDGVILVVDKRIVDKLIVGESVEKIFQIDRHIGAAATGYVMDGRVLIEKAQLVVQQHMVTYGVPMDTLSLVKEIANIKQAYTQYGGARPFGISILFIGVDDEPVLFLTEPTGIYFEYNATAIGEFENEVKESLRKEYSPDMGMEEGLRLALGILKKVLGKDFDIKRIDAAYIDAKDKEFKKFDRKKLKI